MNSDGNYSNPTNRMLHNSLHRAMDIRDEADPNHHEHAPEVEAMRAISEEMDAEFYSDNPSSEKLHTLLDQKDMLQSHGVRMTEEEALWRDEFDNAIDAVENGNDGGKQ